MSELRRANQPSQGRVDVVSQSTWPQGNQGPQRGPRSQDLLTEVQRSTDSWKPAPASVTERVQYFNELTSGDQGQLAARTRGQNTLKNVANAGGTSGSSQQVMPRGSSGSFSQGVASLASSRQAVSCKDVRSNEPLMKIQEKVSSACQRGSWPLTTGAASAYRTGETGPLQRCSTPLGEASSQQQAVHEGMTGLQSQGHLRGKGALPNEHLNKETRAMCSKYGEFVRDVQKKLFHEESPGVTSMEFIDHHERTTGAQPTVHDEVRRSQQNMSYQDSRALEPPNFYEGSRTTLQSAPHEAARNLQQLGFPEETTGLQHTVQRQEASQLWNENVSRGSGGPQAMPTYEYTRVSQFQNPYGRHTDVPNWGSNAEASSQNIHLTHEFQDPEQGSLFTEMRHSQNHSPLEGTSRAQNIGHREQTGNPLQRSFKEARIVPSVNSSDSTRRFQQVVSDKAARGPPCKGVLEGIRGFQQKSSPGDTRCSSYIGSAEGNVCYLQGNAGDETQHQGPYQRSQDFQYAIHYKEIKDPPQGGLLKQYRYSPHQFLPKGASDYQSTGSYDQHGNLPRKGILKRRVTTPHPKVFEDPSQRRGQAGMQAETTGGKEMERASRLLEASRSSSRNYSQQQLQMQELKGSVQPPLQPMPWKEPSLALSQDQHGRSDHGVGATDTIGGADPGQRQAEVTEAAHELSMEREQQEQLSESWNAEECDVPELEESLVVNSSLETLGGSSVHLRTYKVDSEILLLEGGGEGLYQDPDNEDVLYRLVPTKEPSLSPVKEQTLEPADPELPASQLHCSLTADVSAQDVSRQQQSMLRTIKDLLSTIQTDLEEVNQVKDRLAFKVIQIMQKMREVREWTQHLEYSWNET